MDSTELAQKIVEELADTFFDDLLMYKDKIYYFYQVKHTISKIGGVISLNDLLDSEKSNISIDKMYKSYKKINSFI